MPIQIDSMGRLLRRRLDHPRGGGALRERDDPLWANFSATMVRYILSLAPAPTVHSCRCPAPAPEAACVLALAGPAPVGTLIVVSPVDAVDLASVASAAQAEHLPALLSDALNQP
jgi:hypothetical protein